MGAPAHHQQFGVKKKSSKTSIILECGRKGRRFHNSRGLEGKLENLKSFGVWKKSLEINVSMQVGKWDEAKKMRTNLRRAFRRQLTADLRSNVNT